MKHDELVRDIRKAARSRGLDFEMVRQGGSHEVWQCGTVKVAIARHGDIGPKMEFEIRKELEPVLGERWWRK
jgi:hypothetical protein